MDKIECYFCGKSKNTDQFWDGRHNNHGRICTPCRIIFAKNNSDIATYNATTKVSGTVKTKSKPRKKRAKKKSSWSVFNYLGLFMFLCFALLPFLPTFLKSIGE